MKPNTPEWNAHVADARRAMLANRDYNKLFGIGDNKTGTTSLARMLRLCGFKVAPQGEQEATLTRQVFRRNYEPLKSFVGLYDAFQDLPFSQFQTFIVADALFPDSRFILTERDPEQWFTSLVNFHKKAYGIEDINSLTEQFIKENFQYLYDGYGYEVVKRQLTVIEQGRPVTRWDLLYNKEFYIRSYIERNNQIKRHFHEKSDALLVLDLAEHSSSAVLCDFLKVPKKFVANTPKLNATE